MNQLIEWKESPDRKPLLLTGVKHCGKTWTTKEFGEKYFNDVAYFNFEENKVLSSVFEYDLNVERILDELGNIIRGKTIIPGKTLVIFDNIHTCPNAITSLKYFCETKRDLHMICISSMLSVVIKQERFSFPIGKVDRIHMYTMSFSEFLRAEDKSDIYESIQKNSFNHEILQPDKELLEKELKYYIIVGGMPEAVSKWIETHSFEDVEKIQENILSDYDDVFFKYASTRNVAKIGLIYDSIPKQLVKNNNKFIYSDVKAGKRYADFETALVWLEDAGLIHKLEFVKTPEMPLSFYADSDIFKVYMHDVGLLRKKSGVSYKDIIEDSNSCQNFKSAFIENFILNELIKMNIHPYYLNSGNTAKLELIFEFEDKIISIEPQNDTITYNVSLYFIWMINKSM